MSNFTLSFMVPPARMTFESALSLTKFAEIFKLNLKFNGFTGYLTFDDVPSPKEFTVLDEMKLYDPFPTYAGMDGVMDFGRFYGRTATMSMDAVRVYCQMCEEGKVW